MIVDKVWFRWLLFLNKLISVASQPPLASPCAPYEFTCQWENLPEDERRNYISIPWLDTEAGLARLDPSESMYSNDVYCWPSVGGIIIAQELHAVEISYIGLDRFNPTPRSFNTTEEDEFCMRLRKIGGKWWRNYNDFSHTTLLKMRRMWPDEREVLLLGWPEKGGVWVLRYENQKVITAELGLGRVWNAFDMEERCLALEQCGAVFFENPEESEHVRPLLEGFGTREERRDPDNDEEGWWDHGYEL